MYFYGKLLIKMVEIISVFQTDFNSFRCEKIIVVLSKNFTQNDEAMYLLKVAVSRAPGRY